MKLLRWLPVLFLLSVAGARQDYFTRVNLTAFGPMRLVVSTSGGPREEELQGDLKVSTEYLLREAHIKISEKEADPVLELTAQRITFDGATGPYAYAVNLRLVKEYAIPSEKPLGIGPFVYWESGTLGIAGETVQEGVVKAQAEKAVKKFINEWNASNSKS